MPTCPKDKSEHLSKSINQEDIIRSISYKNRLSLVSLKSSYLQKDNKDWDIVLNLDFSKGIPEINESVISDLEHSFQQKLVDDCWIQEIDDIIK